MTSYCCEILHVLYHHMMSVYGTGYDSVVTRLGYIIPFFLPIMLFFYAYRFHLLCFTKVPIILMLLTYYAQ